MYIENTVSTEDEHPGYDPRLSPRENNQMLTTAIRNKFIAGMGLFSELLSPH